MNEQAVSQWIADMGIWPLIVMLLPSVLLFRKFGQEARKKRLASLLQAIAVFVLVVAAGGIVTLGLGDKYLLLAIVAIALAGYFLRARMFPYRTTCPECGKKHDLLSAEIKNTYVMDDDLCDQCRAAGKESEE